MGVIDSNFVGEAVIDSAATGKGQVLAAADQSKAMRCVPVLNKLLIFDLTIEDLGQHQAHFITIPIKFVRLRYHNLIE